MRVWLAAICFFTASLVPAIAVEPEAPETLIKQRDAVRFLILDIARKQAAAKNSARLKARFEALLAFYEARNGETLWVENGAFTAKREEVASVFSRAEEFGLNGEDYQIPSVIRLDGAEFPAERIARAEIEMSNAVLTYASHAQAGRFVPQDVTPNFDHSPDLPSAEAVLAPIAQGADIAQHLEGFHPQTEQFRALRAELANVLRGKTAEAAISVPPRGPTINPGDSHPDVEAIRARLGAPRPASGESADFYDPVLVDAVRAFQSRSKLADDGIVGPSTRAAFYVPPPPGKDILVANMERWRWLPRSLGDTYVRVNIPEYIVRVIQDDRAIFEERIVVGKPQNQTPIFSDEMETVVFNPFWNVPGSITVKEILPLVRRNPAYLERNNLEVFVTGRRRPIDPYYVDWDTINPNKLFIRQPPGDDNALGKVKFLFPNKHSVYMHDTPTKHLFNQRARAYSHGCMRVRNPRIFAEVLLRSQGWTRARVEQTINRGAHDVNVPVKPKIPVHIMYFTLWAGEDGRLTRFSDIYGHDERVLAALRSAQS